MSFLLYNPLEAMILILPLWLLNKHRINFAHKKSIYLIFIKDCYVVGSVLVLILYYKIRFRTQSLLQCLIIMILFYLTLSLCISNNYWYDSFIINNQFLLELVLNLFVRIVQFIIFMIYLWGYNIMLKKNLISIAKKNLGKTVASTLRFVGESKLSKKLQKEVKESK